jgi:tetratricopeptide (TPR) repeat protein
MNWEYLSAWYNEWLAADPVGRERLRARIASEQPDLVAEAEALTAASGHVAGFLETPALVLAAEDLAQEDPLLSADSLIGPYRLVNLLARGGTGDVYRATDVRLRRDVAVKVLAQSRTGDPQRVERFMHEARMTASLDHPNIVRVYDVGRVDDRAYLVAELLEGETLRARIAGRAMPIDDVVRIGIDIARGLDAAHAAGLVHRDLKPDNVFVTDAGLTKILDFGIAKLAQDEPGRDGFATVTGVVLGTAGYLSPEQIRGQVIDARADLFALGAVLFEMLTATRAFGREHMVETLHAILHDPPSDALANRDDVPPGLADLVLKLLEKSPDARFQSAAEVIEALERGESHTPRRRRRNRLPVSIARAGRRRTPWIAVPLIAVLLAGAAAAWKQWQSSGSSVAANITLAVMPFELTPSADGNELLGLGLAALLADRLGQQLASGRVLAAVDTAGWKTKDAGEAVRRLSATHVLSGRLARENGRTVATAELFSAADGRVTALDPLDLPADRSGSVDAALVSHLIPRVANALEIGTRATVAKRGTRNERAREAYLRGRAIVLRPVAEDLKRAAGFFQEAIDLDPDYAEAWAGLGSAYKRMPITGGLPPKEAFPRAEKAALKALELDQANAEGYSVLGTKALSYDWDFPAAERYLKKALDLQPNHADSHLFLGNVYSHTGRHEEALNEIRRAQEIDPQWPQARAMQGLYLVMARKYDDALRHLDLTATATDPTLWTAHTFRADALIGLGRLNEAMRSYERSVELGGSPLNASLRAHYLALMGRREEAEAALAKIPIAQQYNRALALHALGRNEEAMVALNAAVDNKTVMVAALGVQPKWDRLRNFQPFRDVLQRVNLLEVSDRTVARFRLNAR